jgi:hypothetical protein
MVPEPRAVLLCLHQLIAALFSHPGGSSAAAETKSMTSTSYILQQPLADVGLGFFERCIGTSRRIRLAAGVCVWGGGIFTPASVCMQAAR